MGKGSGWSQRPLGLGRSRPVRSGACRPRRRAEGKSGPKVRAGGSGQRGRDLGEGLQDQVGGVLRED
jgi:hypothetical protein